MDIGRSSALTLAGAGFGFGSVLWSTTTDAVEGRTSAKDAQGSDFSG
jgi:hypothetical protein